MENILQDLSLIVEFFQVLADNTTEKRTKQILLEFPQHVSANKEMRDASVAADKKLSEFHVEIRSTWLIKIGHMMPLKA